MKPLQLVLVTRRFWPQIGDAEKAIASLAGEFLRQGQQPTVVTAQWDKTWPQSVVYGNVPVVRFPQPVQPGWGTFRYMRGLNHWLRSQLGNIDLVYVSMLRYDAYATVGALKGSQVPIVLRAEGSGALGDCQWQRTANFGRRIRNRCIQAAAVVAMGQAVQAELLEAGFRRDSIHRMNHGVPLGLPRDPARTNAARAALAEVNQELKLPPRALLTVYCGRLHPVEGLNHLIAAWGDVVQRFPAARLWLVGEGTANRAIRTQIANLRLTDRVLLPGVFDSIDDVLHAADLFVTPSLEGGLSLSLVEAMAAGLPVVATDIPQNRSVAFHNETGLLVPPGSESDLVVAIERLLGNPVLARRLGAAARQRVAEAFTLEAIASQHLGLFRQIKRKHS